MKVAILHDRIGPDDPPDQQDTLVQVEEIGRALTRLGHRPAEVALDLDLDRTSWELSRRGAEVVFNLVETIGGRGENLSAVPRLLEQLGLAFTGAGSRAVELTTHKPTAKRLMAAHRLPTPAWVDEYGTAEGAAFRAGREFIIKSAWEHGSAGLEGDSVVKADDGRDLCEHLARRKGILGGEWFAEEFIDGREFNISLLADREGCQVLPPAEIRFDDFGPAQRRLVGYRAKWDPTSSEYHTTPRSFTFGPADSDLLRRVTGLARRCWPVFGLDGYARVDFRVDRFGRPFILEINANPCLSADAGFAAAADMAGLDQTAVVDRLVADALYRRGRRTEQMNLSSEKEFELGTS